MRFVGFTGHKDPAIHLRDARHRLPVRRRADAAQPVRRARSAASSTQVLPESNRRGIAALGMKPLGGDGDAVTEGRADGRGGAALRDEPAGGDDDQRHGHAEVLRAEPAVAQGFQPMTADEMQALRERCRRGRRRRPLRAVQGLAQVRQPRGAARARFPLDQQQVEVEGDAEGHTTNTGPPVTTRLLDPIRRSFCGRAASAGARRSRARLASRIGARARRRAGLRARRSAATTSARRHERERRRRRSSRGDRRRRQLHRQRVGVPRRQERGADGQGARGRRDQRRSDDEGLHARPRRERRHAHARGVAASSAGPTTSTCGRSTRSSTRTIPTSLRARRRHRGAAAREGAGEGQF